MRQTLVLVVVGGASAGALAAGVATSSLLLDGFGVVGLVASAIALVWQGLKEFLDWFVSRAT